MLTKGNESPFVKRQATEALGQSNKFLNAGAHLGDRPRRRIEGIDVKGLN